jgi:hypothetical protein
MLAIVMHPTWQEMPDSGPPEDKARATAQEFLVFGDEALADIPGNDDLYAAGFGWRRLPQAAQRRSSERGAETKTWFA